MSQFMIDKTGNKCSPKMVCRYLNHPGFGRTHSHFLLCTFQNLIFFHWQKKSQLFSISYTISYILPFLWSSPAQVLPKKCFWCTYESFLGQGGGKIFISFFKTYPITEQIEYMTNRYHLRIFQQLAPQTLAQLNGKQHFLTSKGLWQIIPRFEIKV